MQNFLSIHLSKEEWESFTKKVRVKPDMLVQENKGVFYVVTLQFEQISLKFFSPTVY